MKVPFVEAEQKFIELERHIKDVWEGRATRTEDVKEPITPSPPIESRSILQRLFGYLRTRT